MIVQPDGSLALITRVDPRRGGRRRDANWRGGLTGTALKVLRVQLLVKTILSGETVNQPAGDR